jgi:hypothetical protein
MVRVPLSEAATFQYPAVSLAPRMRKLGCKRTYATIVTACWRRTAGNVGSWLSNALRWTEAFDRAHVVIVVVSDYAKLRFDWRYYQIVKSSSIRTL